VSEGALERRIASMLATLRKERGISQQALALELGRDQTVISRIESGQRRVTVPELFEWADALGVPFHRVAEELEAISRELVETRSIWERERG
jgi:transcriptional regulator with XRE-family HTH domain